MLPLFRRFAALRRRAIAAPVEPRRPSEPGPPAEPAAPRSLQKSVHSLSAATKSMADALTAAARRESEDGEDALTQTVDRLSDLRLDELRDEVRRLSVSVRRHVRYTKAMQDDQRAARRPAGAPVFKQLAALAAGHKPIVVGPWIGDVGLELMYWVPFVRWFTQHFHVDPQRLDIISRGGAPWYDDLGARYIDLSSIYAPSELQAWTERCGGQPDAEFARDVAARVVNDRRAVALLHPSLMYELFAPYWRHEASFQHVARYTAPRRPSPPELALPGLPDRYLAVRFAFGPQFPDTPANRARLDLLIASLSASHNVVWLGGGAGDVDGPGQTEYSPAPSPGVHHVERLVAGPDTLAVQAAIIARSEAYVGTYGGLAYVAPLYGVRSISFYAVRDFFPHYRRTADHILAARRKRSLIVVDVADQPLLAAVLGAAGAAAEPVGAAVTHASAAAELRL